MIWYLFASVIPFTFNDLNKFGKYSASAVIIITLSSLISSTYNINTIKEF